MSVATRPEAAPDYGLDAPTIIYAFLGVALGGLVLLGGGLLATARLAPTLWPLALIGLVPLTLGLFTATAMTLSSRVGKIRLRDRLLDELGLRGDEDVLDLGCGRGLMLLGAATRLPGGTATGIDLWRAQDQKGTTRANCAENARRVGVADRVTLKDCDMTDLPFPDRSFDLVTASLAIHNISDREGRAETLREAARVLRPGGRLLIVDFSKTEEYAADARSAGLVDVTRSGQRRSMYPFVRVVSAVKPAAATGI